MAIGEWLAVRSGRVIISSDLIFVAIDFAAADHRIRCAITTVLDATDGNVRKVQKLSRNKKLDTLMIYDDNRGRDQQDISQTLDGMF